MGLQVVREKERRSASLQAFGEFATVAKMLLAPVLGWWTHI